MNGHCKKQNLESKSRSLKSEANSNESGFSYLDVGSLPETDIQVLDFLIHMFRSPGHTKQN